MATESPLFSINLPELTLSRFGMLSADVHVSTGDADLVHPQLTLEGDEDAFDHSFNDGRLNVREKADHGTIVTHVGASGRSVVIGNGNFNGVVVSGGSVRVDGVDILVGGGSASVHSARRRASLILPPGHPASYDIDTKSGDVDLESLTARALKVATMSGDIALRGSEVSTVMLNSMSGDVEVEDTKSETSVSVKTMSGDIDVTDSEAPSWRLTTMSGDIKAKATKGEVDASSMSGRTRVS
jgi:hypothetical protein